MFKKLFDLSVQNNISLTSTIKGGFSFDLLQTTDAQKVAQKVLNTLYSYFTYPGTKCVLDLYKKQHNHSAELFEKEYPLIHYNNNTKTSSFPYSYCIVTSDEQFYNEVKNSITITFLSESESLEFLQDYELVLCVDSPQVSWHVQHSKEIIKRDALLISSFEKAQKLYSLFDVCSPYVKSAKKMKEVLDSLSSQTSISHINYSDLLEKVNEQITKKIDSLSFSAADMLSSLSSGQLPDSIVTLIEEKCSEIGLPTQFIEMKLPVTINEDVISQSQTQKVREKAYDTYLALQENKDILLSLNTCVSECHATILLHDFIHGMRNFIQDFNCHVSQIGTLSLEKSSNILIDKPQPITYMFGSYQSLILTGANSGGKTTLLEHIIQLYVLYNLCLPTPGTVTIDTSIQSIYYFAKNKGGTKKGAFEQLLHKLAQVNSDSLILADEMEAVTEPSVAASIMSSTISFFHTKQCRMILATHLGKILQPLISDTVRVDGIVAKGLDEKQNVIIDHNPVMGKIAESTPELIVQKMALKKRNEYLQYLAESFH